jgi:4-aminobutyrate aminotransferase-like enzyme/Ser/Thr protein kinase RdoA (MazF antagonist)
MTRHTLKSEEVALVVKENYALDVKAKLLPGYDDWNYLLITSEGHKRVLKISDESKSLKLLQAEIAVTTFLNKEAKKGLFPKYIPNLQNEFLTVLPSMRDKKKHARLLTYLSGTFWAELTHHSEALLIQLGKFLGRMDSILLGFDHCGAHRYYEWDIQHVADWQEHLHHIASHHDRRVASYFLLQFETYVQPFLSDLRHSIIHNDANDWNLLVEEERIRGLIDFGDIVYAPMVQNLAVALAYAMQDKDEPLKAAALVVKGYHQRNNLTEQGVDLLYYLIAARLCVSVINSAIKKSSGSSNPHHFLTEESAWQLLHQLLQINPVNAQQTFRNACGMPILYEKGKDSSSLLETRNKHIGRNLSISYRKPLKIIRGALQYLYDDQGNTYLDCVNNVSHVGHCHPAVVKPMQEQIATLNTNTRYLHDKLGAYADLLCNTLPDSLSICYFTNSGSEANDLAVRMARHFTDQKDVIVLDHAYHGTTTLAIEMSPYKFDGPGGFPQPDYIHKAQNPDCYRGEYRYDDPLAGRKYAECINGIIETLKNKGKKPAAFICETLLGVGGQIPLPDDYLKTAYEYIHSAGGLCIADEVQVGFGRVGETFWGFQLQQVVPDMVVMGKPMGDGHPLSAVVTTQEIADSFDNGMEYFNTFGGNPVSMVTGEAVMRVIFEEELQKNSFEIGSYLLEQLKDLKRQFAIIGDVRGKGLFIGVEFVKDRKRLEPAVDELNEVVERMKERGFLLSTEGPLHNVLKIKPPIIFSKQNADDLIRNLGKVLTEVLS